MRVTTSVVMSVLSAIGSRTDPSTDFWFHLRARYPSSCRQPPIHSSLSLTQSVNPPATRRPVATSKLPCTIEYARNGHEAIRASVSALGSVYGDSWISSAGAGCDMSTKRYANLLAAGATYL